MALLDEEEDSGFVLLKAQRPLHTTGRLGWLGILESVLCCKTFRRVIHTMMRAVLEIVKLDALVQTDVAISIDLDAIFSPIKLGAKQITRWLI